MTASNLDRLLDAEVQRREEQLEFRRELEEMHELTIQKMRARRVVSINVQNESGAHKLELVERDEDTTLEVSILSRDNGMDWVPLSESARYKLLKELLSTVAMTTKRRAP